MLKKSVTKTVQRAKRYADGGTASLGASIGPAPRANRLVGEFRDPSERAGGIPWLIQWGKNPANVSRELGARRARDPNEPYPERGRGRAALADGGSPIDDLRESFEMAAAHQPTTEERAANLRGLGDEALGMLPVIGNVMSAEAIPQSARDTATAWREGRYKATAGNALLTALNVAGALSPLPWGRAAGRAAREGAGSARIFVGPNAKGVDHAALARAEDMRAAGVDRDTIWHKTRWGHDERGAPFTEIDDSAARLKPQDVADPQYFDEFLDHPPLFKSLPDMEKIRFSETSAPNTGFYQKAKGLNVDGRIDIGPGDDTRRLSMALHEGQHAVDAERGASPGTSAVYLNPDDEAETLAAMTRRFGQPFTDWHAAKQNYDDLYHGPFGEMSPDFAEALRRLKAAEPALARAQGRDGMPPVTPAAYAYWHNPGEARARNVEARREFSANDRAAVPPWHTLDVDETDILGGRGASTLPSQVLIPPTRIEKADRAIDMIEGGAKNRDIFKDTGLAFGAEGRLRQEISDRSLTTNMKDFKAGDVTTMGDFVNHPELFDARPDLRKMPLELTSRTVDSKDHTMRRPIAQTAQSGVAEMTIGQDQDWTREQLAKLLQYQIAKDAGYGGSVRHTASSMLPQYERGVDVARTMGDDPAALAYLAKHEPLRNQLDTALKSSEFRNRAGVAAQKSTSGNAESRLVRWRANSSKNAHDAAGPFFYNAGISPLDKYHVIPQPDMSTDEVAALIRDWHKYGGGRGRYARGGRVKAVVGAVRGPTGGREDALPVHVPAGSYVIPADVVGALGQGNTEAGMTQLERTLGGMPKRANGGSVGTVPILISDGEFVVSPDAVQRVGGAEALDRFVLATRKAFTEHLQGLPGPQ